MIMTDGWILLTKIVVGTIATIWTVRTVATVVVVAHMATQPSIIKN